MIINDVMEHVSLGLQRASIQTCSRWAENYRFIKGKQWKHDRYKWLQEIEDADSRLVIGQKAAQIGYTEAALNKTFFKIDIQHTDVLYVLPSESDASDFSSGRFDPALEESKHLRRMFSDVNNVGLKRAGSSMLYVRGGKSRSRLKSIPTGFIVLDEIDEMPEEHIPLVLERFSGQEIKQCFMLSTPTVPGHGINKYYVNSTCERFFFECPHCNKQIELKFPQSIVITAEHVTDEGIKNSHYICYECKHRLDREEKIAAISTGSFVAEYPERSDRGFNVNQMYSPTVEAWELAQSYLKSLYDPTEEQEFFNSKLGATHIVGDARVIQENLDGCKEGYLKRSAFTTPLITMGVDVGANWHYEIAEWIQLSDHPRTLDANDVFEPRVMDEGEIPLHDGVDKLILLLRKFQVKGCVIDRHPETYAVRRISSQFPDVVYPCMFGRGITSRQLNKNDADTEQQFITVDRTSWFDCALGRFPSGKISLPKDISLTYQKQMQVPVRIYERDKSGNPVGRWVSESRNDHFALARVYNEIALRDARQFATLKYGESILMPIIEHPTYSNDSNNWKRWRLAYKGGRDFVKQYLKQYSTREDSTDFADRKEITYCPGFAGAAIDEIRNMIFSRLPDVTRVSDSQTYHEACKGNLLGVDLKGSSIDNFVGVEVLAELLVMRKVGVYVDMPRVVPKAISARRDIHPYYYVYPVEDIISWEHGEPGSGHVFTKMLLRDNFYEKDTEWSLITSIAKRYRFLEVVPEGVKVTIYDDELNNVQESVILPLPTIPFIVLELKKSLMEDVADYQIALLNLESSDIDFARKANFPVYTEQAHWTDVLPGVKPAGQDTGPNNDDTDATVQAEKPVTELSPTQGRRYGKGLDRPGFIHPSPAPIEASMKKQERMKQDIRQLVQLAVSGLGNKSVSIESKEFDQQGIENGLSWIALVLEEGERKLGEVWNMYERVKGSVVVSYPRYFDIRTDEERQQEANRLGDLARSVPSKDFQRHMLKKIVTTLVGNQVTTDDLREMHQQIDTAKSVTADPKTILEDLEAGLVTSETASEIRGYPDGEAEKAQKEKADRMAMISAAQGGLTGDARGVPDGQTDQPSSEDEKAGKPGRGEEKG